MKEIFIEREGNVLRIAIKNNNKLKECFIEEEKYEPIPGQIYKGVVKNIIPGIKSAFIDIGTKKNCYMYIDKKLNNTDIKKGSDILVQILKESIGKKGPKVTNRISLPGRYCVIDSFDKGVKFSKKIDDKDFKEYVVSNIEKITDAGIMVRTNALKVDISTINEEISKLYIDYKEILNKSRYSLKNGLIFDNGGILGKILRDKIDDITYKIYANDDEDYNYIKEFVKSTNDVHIDLEHHKDDIGLFHYYGIEKEILSLRNNKVILHCGGNVVIDKTEAMYVIDVNSSKNTSGSSLDKTAYTTNMQAAKEIANQIRLRNLSGIIVIDFIDMYDNENKANVLNELKKGFEGDNSKATIYPFTELNLVQIARRRMGKSIYEYIEEKCDSCKGKGKRLKLSYITLLLKNEITRIGSQKSIKNLHIQINEMYEKDIKGDILKFVSEIDALNKTIYLSFIEGEEYFNVEPLIFANQMENLRMYRVYG